MRSRIPYRRRLLRGLLASLAAVSSARALSARAQGTASSPAGAAPRPAGSGGAAPQTGQAEAAAPRPAPRQVIRGGRTRIALLLPSAEGPFRRAAEAVVAGVRAAHARGPRDTTVEVIEVLDRGENLADIHAELARRRFALAIGPLTRDTVNAAYDAGVPPVPTLLLNTPEGGRFATDNLIVFGLAIELEAQQVARLAHAAAAPAAAAGPAPLALVVANSTPLARRAADAFAEEWLRLGGRMGDPVETDSRMPGEVAPLLARRRADAWFVATAPEAARAVVAAAAGAGGRAWATSMLNTGALPGGEGAALLRSPELDGLNLVEMPWQVQPDNAAVMAYPRMPGLNLELQRLYALGIDAMRLAQELTGPATRIEIDGVTGALVLDLNVALRVERTLVHAQYRDGVLVPVAQS